jgi:hypothetical protein
MTTASINRPLDQRWPSMKVAAVACGILPTLLGVIVLVGWYAENETLIQVSPAFVPMQYNTALGFLASGIGLSLVLRPIDLGARVFAGLTTLIGVLTLFEYGVGVDLGIDQLLMDHYITVATSNPGRMAPNTALCFALAGTGVLISRGSLIARHKLAVVGMLGSLVFGLGVIAFSGYFIGLETAYGWGNLTRMAVHTSAGFIVLGIGLIAYVWDQVTDRSGLFPPWFSIVVCIVVLTVTVSLWQALNAV